jgi:hypothetical protein
MTTLIVAAGGGGDAITASALTRALSLTDLPVVMTYAWDRLMIDPLPGPRAASDFTGLREVAPSVLQIAPTTQPSSPAGSSLPRLAAELPARLLLLDPSGGTVGLAEQIVAAMTYFGANEVAAIDVGGDSLTTGADPGLRSPLADQLTIAACLRAGVPGRLLVAAPGIDGELDQAVVVDRLEEMNAEDLPALSAHDFAGSTTVFRWHPSEASGLLAAAATGHRGVVEIRDAGDQITLTDDTTRLYSVDFTALSRDLPAHRLVGSQSLNEAERLVRDLTGISELEYEAGKAERLADRQPHMPDTDDLDTIDHEAKRAADRGADYISMRRLAELIGSTSLASFEALTDLLTQTRPDKYKTSLYSVAP